MKQYENFVYIIQCNDLFKIGFSKKPLTRLNNFSQATIIPYKVMLIALLSCENHVSKENEIHKEFKEFRVTGEWFMLNSKTLNLIITKYGFSLHNEPIFKIDNCSDEVHLKILERRLEYDIMKCNEKRLEYQEGIEKQEYRKKELQKIYNL